ncbi:MAG: cob(I)yrinic acid a,c-diamide adenosyltransferase [Pseudomonadaceae bacterium]|nr:cob(I)yrinic acid a,c-diamide adenosyltransferase [Pseudomonadaceae bacterium]
MGKRLSKIVTKTGDDGTTGLTGGGRVSKASIRMEAIGTIDELNSHIGMFLAELDPASAYAPLYRLIQNDLFDMGGELSMPGVALITDAHVSRLEDAVDEWNDALPPLTNFILPGGSRVVAACHLVRTVARRAERVLVAMAEAEEVNLASRQYLNRLSDLSFVAGRAIATENGTPEVLWQQSKPEV